MIGLTIILTIGLEIIFSDKVYNSIKDNGVKNNINDKGL